MSGGYFILDCLLAFLGKENVHLAFLLFVNFSDIVFCVSFFSLCFVGRKMKGNCIDS